MQEAERCFKIQLRHLGFYLPTISCAQYSESNLKAGKEDKVPLSTSGEQQYLCIPSLFRQKPGCRYFLFKGQQEHFCVGTNMSPA